ncbi:Ribonuclease P protein subunit p40 [Smittium culicis]|uniref:Ribonuclease P protein subunit p40 n=1 Tax=Smittium culicis TaxID=133412 RepID=A0A1R1X4A9_9FUNG|nr:Ribonuclease P protein subunit p40 [Smittium culicis]OMJ12620.1 Ribonuclease P protein subunit p40 [Smittium culicis]
MKPGEKVYERTMWAFTNSLNDTYEFIFGYFDHVTGKSLEVKFGPGSEHLLEEHSLSIKSEVKGCNVPKSIFGDLSAKNFESTDMYSSELMDLVEWIGLISLADDDDEPDSSDAGLSDGYLRLEGNVDVAIDSLVSDIDPFISLYSIPEPNDIMKVSVTSVGGLVNPKIINDLANAIQSKVDHFVLVVSGFTDTPISWYNKPHGFLTSGENLYVQVRNSRLNTCLTARYCGAYDSFS